VDCCYDVVYREKKVYRFLLIIIANFLDLELNSALCPDYADTLLIPTTNDNHQPPASIN